MTCVVCGDPAVVVRDRFAYCHTHGLERLIEVMREAGDPDVPAAERMLADWREELTMLYEAGFRWMSS